MLLDTLLRLAIWIGLGPSQSDVAALQRTATEHVAADVAAEHIMAARVAAAEYGVDADLVLAIADHESRYTDAQSSHESGGRVSCGAMTPEPIARCPRDGLIGGYRRGAAHLADWIHARRGDLRGALLGYAGGYLLIHACAEGPHVVVRKGREIDLCQTPDVFLARSRWIRREMARARASSS
jgi:hypothetical protein